MATWTKIEGLPWYRCGDWEVYETSSGTSTVWALYYQTRPYSRTVFRKGSSHQQKVTFPSLAAAQKFCEKQMGVK